VLLERKQLTCGTTWHAAGLIGQLRGTQNMTRLAKYSADLYVKLEEETGVATGMRQVGSISVGLTARRRRNSCARPRSPAPSTSTWGDHCRRGQGDVSPSQHRRRHLRRAPARRRAVRSRQHRHGAGQGRTDERCAQIVEGVKVTAVTADGKRVTGVDWEQGEETARSRPTSSSIAAACGAAIWPRNRA
jgi:glycine/D-amino acid oxidase-like deaminating enzyme